MRGPSIEAARVTRRLHAMYRIAAVLLGVAVVTVVFGLERITLAAIILVLFVQLFSLEALRVLTLSFREHRK